MSIYKFAMSILSMGLIGLGLSSIAGAQVNLTGTWQPDIARATVVHITQQGNRVDMIYEISGYFGSTISGTFDGHTFRGTYQSREANASDSGWVTSTLLP